MKKIYKRNPIKHLYKEENRNRTISSLDTVTPPVYTVNDTFEEGHPSLEAIDIESFIFGSGSLSTVMSADFTNTFPYNASVPGHPNYGGTLALGGTFYTILEDNTEDIIEGVKGLIPNAGGLIIGDGPDYVDLVEDGKTINDEEILQLEVNGETFNIGTHEVV